MILPRRVRSYNRRGGHWAEYRERQAWEKAIRDAEYGLPVDQRPKATLARIRCVITRLAPSQRYLLDADNFAAGAKRLIDSLVKTGYLVDDTPRWLDLQLVQKVSSDKKYWTVVSLTEAEQQDAPVIDVVSPADFSQMRARRRIAQCAKRAA